jgi:peptidoglycan/LPS O-acetylase OafA/YrhL
MNYRRQPEYTLWGNTFRASAAYKIDEVLYCGVSNAAWALVNSLDQKRRAMSLETHSRLRIPSLDGLRALSILIVIVAHVCGTVNLNFPPLTHKLSSFGSFGVKVFFVISGYLITRLLMTEEARYGRISIGDFYVRRSFRIWPVAYAFILVVAVLQARGLILLPPHNILYAATFTMNHAPEAIWWTGHLWSLALEEQFYLVWPVLFLFSGTRTRIWSCVWFILLTPALRLATDVYLPQTYQVMEASLLFVGLSIAVGCLLALTEAQLQQQKTWLKVMQSKAFFVFPVAAVVAYGVSVSNLGKGYFVAGDTLCVLCIGATVWRVVHYEDLTFRILNTSFLMLVGRLSYSLYIWQQFFLNKYSTAWATRFPQNLVLAVAVSAVSYRLIELPALSLRQRIPWMRRGDKVKSALETESRELSESALGPRVEARAGR